jgi:hypothetical protein
LYFGLDGPFQPKKRKISSHTGAPLLLKRDPAIKLKHYQIVAVFPDGRVQSRERAALAQVEFSPIVFPAGYPVQGFANIATQPKSFCHVLFLS